jgi:hypothetical protein
VDQKRHFPNNTTLCDFIEMSSFRSFGEREILPFLFDYAMPSSFTKKHACPSMVSFLHKGLKEICGIIEKATTKNSPDFTLS